MKNLLKRMDELIDMIAGNDTKGCPDPVGGPDSVDCMTCLVVMAGRDR